MTQVSPLLINSVACTIPVADNIIVSQKSRMPKSRAAQTKPDATDHVLRSKIVLIAAEYCLSGNCEVGIVCSIWS